MPATQHETRGIPPSTMLSGIVETICDRPNDSQQQRDARAREVVDAVQGFAPRDPVELMLAGMAVLHAYLIQDAARDLMREQDDRRRSKTKSAIVALDRVMLGFLRELRVARKRPLETGGDTETYEAIVAPAEARAEVDQSPEPEIAVCPPPMPSGVGEPPDAVLKSPVVMASVSAIPSVVTPPARPFARLPLTAKAKRQQTKALKILARRAAAANRSQPGPVVPGAG